MTRLINKQERLSTSWEWDAFFKEGGSWEANRGRSQTRLFAEAFCRHTSIDLEEGQSLLDSGCALGDALPVLNKRFPKAQLYACDFSTTAIQRCKDHFPELASFFLCPIEGIEDVYDVIYSSNTLEHFCDYREKARQLLQHCRYLCILVPYDEHSKCGKDLEYDPYCHHVVTFREHSFEFLLDEGLAKKIRRPKVFAVPKAWSWTLRTRIKQSLKNVFRLLLKRPLARNGKQILFEIEAIGD